MNLHATHPAAWDPACLVCRPFRGLFWYGNQPNPDPLRPPETDEPWTDEHEGGGLWLGWVILLAAALFTGVVIGRWTA